MFDAITNGFSILVLSLFGSGIQPPEPEEITTTLPQETYEALHQELHNQVGDVFRSHEGPLVLVALGDVARAWEQRLAVEVSSNNRG